MPDHGYSPIVTSDLTSGVWQDEAYSSIFANGSQHWALIPPASLPGTSAGFFALVQRTFTQLQVILPGETDAPGTPSGKTGTPTAVSLGAGGLETVTVNATDATWHLISGIGDTVELSSSDPGALLPANTALANGTVTFAPMQFNNAGSQTVTATDFSDGSKLPNTSTPVTVGP